MSEQVFGCRRSTKASSLPHHPSNHPTIHPSIPKRAFTCLPGRTTMYPGVRVPDTVSCPYLLCRAAALPLWDRIHAQIIHSVKSQFSCMYTTVPQCVLVNVRDLRGRAQFGKCMETGESETTDGSWITRSRVIHCSQKAPQGAHPQRPKPGHENNHVLGDAIQKKSLG